MIKALEPVRREVVVPVGKQRAFEVFTADMTRWWPSTHHIGTADIEEVLVEPREGGRWYTRHVDGSETSTGYVSAWSPPDHLAMTWQIGADWHYHPDLVTMVEVSFVAVSESSTLVKLEHRDLEAFGPDAERMRDRFSQPGAWAGILAAFVGSFEATRR
jgi:uncharacterized protein YndB with AHSA1/START domain